MRVPKTQLFLDRLNKFRNQGKNIDDMSTLDDLAKEIFKNKPTRRLNDATPEEWDKVTRKK